MTPDFLFFFIFLLAVGVGAGFSAGLLGIGGGAILVPCLYYLFSSPLFISVAHAQDYDPAFALPMAIATSCASIVFTAWRSARQHHKKGAVLMSIVWPSPFYRSWGLWIGIGALFGGAWVIKIVPVIGLQLLFGGVLLFIAVRLIVKNMRFSSGPSQFATVPQSFWVIMPVSFGIGSLSALMGIGGASFSVPLMVKYGVRIHHAIGTASLLGLFISLPAMIGYIISGQSVVGLPVWTVGYIYAPAVSIIMMTSIFCVPWGVKLAHFCPQRRLQILFGIFLLCVALNMLRQAFIG